MRHGAFRLVLALALALAGPRATPAGEIEEARAMLEDASGRLERAADRGERVRALAAAVQAHERALAVLRAGLRRLAREDRRLAADLADDHDRLVRLTGALQSFSRAPKAAMLAFPGGPVRAARAAAVMGAVAPAMERAVAALSARLEGLRAVRVRQELARAQAGEALAAMQDLRARALGAARGGGTAPDRATLKRQAAVARARARDLEGLAGALAARRADAPPAIPFAERRGTLLSPVSGQVTTGFGGVDPWGRTGRGITYTAPSGAMVSAPAAATVRYAGPLTGYGAVVILEPAQGWLMVLAGLDTVNAAVAETVLAGERLGTLAGPPPEVAEFSLDAGPAEGQVRDQTLYVELRRNGTAVDPAPWFALGQE